MERDGRLPLAGTYRTPDRVTSNVMERVGKHWDDWTAHDDTFVVGLWR